MIVEESIYIVFDETNDLSLRKKDIIDDNVEILKKRIKELNLKERANQNKEKEIKDNEQEMTLKKMPIRSMMIYPRSRGIHIAIIGISS